jgi:hypothetical protein
MSEKKSKKTKLAEAVKLPTLFITLSDVHIGYQPIEQITKEFFDEEKGFFTKAQELIEAHVAEGIKFGGFAITGDYFDHQLSLNSAHAKFAMDLMHAFIHIAVHYDGTVSLIQGTKSHDLAQINIFEPFTYEYENKFFIVNTVTEMQIAGFDILCIPEEYMVNPTEYYADYFEKKYDMIWGHGFFKFNCFNKNEVERPMPDMPIFDQEEIVDIARLTIFGHDHRYQTYRDMIYYNGSYSRLCHGEEYIKGALLVYIDADTHEVQQLENELAPSFMSVQLDKIVKGELNYETAVKAIKKFKTKTDFLKVKIAQTIVNENPTMVELITSTFNTQYKRGIVIDAPPFNIKNGELVMLCGEAEEDADGNAVEQVQEENKFSYLFDTAISLDDKVARFIDEKHSNSTIKISLDDIRDAISAN